VTQTRRVSPVNVTSQKEEEKMMQGNRSSLGQWSYKRGA
jgi:hypothetical protein